MEIGRRERKALEMRERLSRTGLDLFEQHGYASTRLLDVSDAVDVSVRSTARYFRTKEDLLFADQPGRVAGVEALLRGHDPEAEILDTIRAALELLRDDVREHRRAILVQATVAAEHSGIRLRLLGHRVDLLTLLQGFVADRLPDDDSMATGVQLLATVPYDMFCGSLTRWVLDGAGEAFDPPIDGIVEVAARVFARARA